MRLVSNWRKQNDDAYFQSRANAGIAHIYLDTIQPGMAEPYLREAISFAAKKCQNEFSRYGKVKTAICGKSSKSRKS